MVDEDVIDKAFELLKRYIKLSNYLDPIVNEDNIRPAVEKLLKELSKALDEDFTLTEFSCHLHNKDSDSFTIPISKKNI